MNNHFPSCGPFPLGIYPIVDSVQWVKKLLPLGITTLQLRIKNQPMAFIEQAIVESIDLARHYKARLFINDYWELAIKHQAYGLHLGQDDIHNCDLSAIKKAGLRLGVSTHNPMERVTAIDVNPTYLAFGPLYPTTSKPMPYVPLGLKQLAQCVQQISIPIVAIGGITQEHLRDVLATGVNGVALISAITQSPDPIETTRFFQDVALAYYT